MRVDHPGNVNDPWDWLRTVAKVMIAAGNGPRASHMLDQAYKAFLGDGLAACFAVVNEFDIEINDPFLLEQTLKEAAMAKDKALLDDYPEIFIGVHKDAEGNPLIVVRGKILGTVARMKEIIEFYETTSRSRG